MATWCSAVMVLLAAVGRGLGRPEAPLTGFGSSGGGGFSGLTLDSYAAPIGGGSGGSYASAGGGGPYASAVGGGPYPSSGGPAPQYGPPQQAPVIHKHVYVHVPPPEPTYYAPKKPVQPPPPPQKHYKIVFIKAPTPPPPTVPDIPAIAPPAEQKTLIYVLVKKPDDAPEIHIPTPAPTQPSKPEVYFIRYKTQKQEGYPNSVGTDYGPPASPSPSIPSDTYGSPSPSTGYGAPSGPGSLY